MNERMRFLMGLETHHTIATPDITRRHFVRLSAAAGGGLLIAATVPGCTRKPQTPDDASATTPEPLTDGPDFAPNVWVTLHADNQATVTVGKTEMGQGVRTTLAMLVAEELDLDWSRVQVQTAPADQAKYGRQGTAGSSSIRTAWVPLRQAGAKARAVLVAAAAQKWSVDAASLTTADSHVIHAASKRKIPYGALTQTAAQLPVPADVALKDPKTFRLLGKEHVGVDVQDIVQGRATYGLDVRKPNMVFASVERSPTHGGTVKAFKADSALKVPGVQKVVEVPAVGEGVNVRSGVAVIATNTWAAMEGRKQLEVTWNPGPNARESSARHSATLARMTGKKGREQVNKLGNPDRELKKAKEVIKAQYEVPFLNHATLEPMNFTAEMKDGRCILTGPTQIPNHAQRAVAAALKLAESQVEVNITLIGGGFGRRLMADYVVEAALVAQQLDGPVQVVWSREDDMRNGFYRPVAMHVIEASLDAKGYPHAWRHRMSTPAIAATVGRPAPFGVGESNGASDMLYRVPHRSCEYTYLDSGITRGWWRGVHTTHTTFAVESFIDELAAKAGIDPLTYRLNLIDELKVDQPEGNPDFPWRPERLKGVLQLAAEKAGWGQPVPAGQGRGIACGIDHLSYGAVVIDVTMEGNRPRIDKVVCAADCGPVLNPNGGRAQIEGGVIQALSAALKERITIENGRVRQGNFDTYPLLRIKEAPRVIEAHFIQTDTHPTGLGEPSVPPVAPALASAIAQATGQRPRVLPVEAGIA